MFNFISTLFASTVTLFAAGNEGATCGSYFFGLHSWYYYLPKSDFDGCNIRNFHFLDPGGHPDLPLVLLAIVDDLLIISGMVAVGFVIYGAFQYVASQGNPEQTGRAQSTILNALIGTAVAITAAVFVNFLGQTLGGA